MRLSSHARKECETKALVKLVLVRLPMRRASTFILAALGVLVCAASTTAFAISTNVTFHFYGAVDCGPCMAFKKSHLPHVKEEAARRGFDVAVNIIERSRDIERTGVYGDSDEILRLAAKQLEFVYPPIFFVSRNGVVLAAYRSDWKAALAHAQREAAQGPPSNR